MSEDNVIPENKRFRRFGPDNGNWRGGRGISTQGYIVLRGHYDHRQNVQGMVLEHTVVYEQYHKCCLLKWAQVHHKNRNRQDNRPENLDAMTCSQHAKIHALRIPYNRSCNNCHSTITHVGRSGYSGWFRDRKIGVGFWCRKCYGELYWRPSRKGS